MYCGGIQSDLTDQVMRDTFSEFGNILDVRVFKDKGFSFIRMDTKDAATKAIIATHGTQINGYTCKCSWGKETSESSTGSQSQSASQQNSAYPQQQGYGGMGYYNPMNYWGYPPQGYPPQGYPPMPPAGYAPPYGQGYGYGNYG